MDIDIEIEVKKGLLQAKNLSDGLVNEANRTLIEAEETMADAVVQAKNAGASVSFIASSLGYTRQKIYMLLAMKGIRPGKEVIEIVSS